ncbi:GNAT family N-acetyltransferase [Paenibacillus silviterrae]|uniref:GNAT family N-acetyltransferase n=1 Tax=Paenibacillus silviterrae TaxID=3242194 RepID=UPI002542AF47|nr:GNAT family protein [Paenibacillus chinjuensis]
MQKEYSPREWLTERLALRTAGEADAPQIISFLHRNRGFLEPWEPKRSPEYYTEALQRRELRLEQEKMESGLMWRVWVYLREDAGRQQVIGSVALNNIVRGAFLSCHLGYRMDQDYLNKGYMTEAIREAVRYAFEELGLHRIEANVMPRNAPSLRVLEKLGFQPEGLARKYLKINGVWEDHVHMTMLNEAME